MNKTSQISYIIGSLFALVVWLIWFVWMSITGEKGRFGDVSILFLLLGGMVFLISIFVCDLSVTAKGFTAISFFSKKDFLFNDIEIMSIENWGTRSFQVYTTVRNFTFAYTKANYAALKEIIPLVKYSRISVEELEAMVKKAFFAPS